MTRLPVPGKAWPEGVSTQLLVAEREVAVWQLARTATRPLEAVLSRYLAVPADELTLERDVGGKPFLSGALHASLAHAGDVTLVAVTAVGPVGVDVEPERSDVHRWALVPHVLTPRERERLWQLPEHRRSRAVLAGWTGKEAVLKASGHGLAIEPRRVELGPGPAIVSVPSELGVPEDWFLADIPVEGHVARLAVRGRPARITAGRWRQAAPDVGRDAGTPRPLRLACREGDELQAWNANQNEGRLVPPEREARGHYEDAGSWHAAANSRPRAASFGSAGSRAARRT